MTGTCADACARVHMSLRREVIMARTAKIGEVMQLLGPMTGISLAQELEHLDDFQTYCTYVLDFLHW
jgi:hypothetical protein